MDELGICPVCHEDTGYVEEEAGWAIYVNCANCGTHTAMQSYTTEEEKKAAEISAIQIWNMGKVVKEGRGE